MSVYFYYVAHYIYLNDGDNELIEKRLMNIVWRTLTIELMDTSHNMFSWTEWHILK